MAIDILHPFKGQDKILYTVALERYSPRRGWYADIEYRHAHTQAQARWEFMRANRKQKYVIVGIAPAIGFFVNDNHGDKLSAS